jgi:steroid 5-alpha reductase family enzyme
MTATIRLLLLSLILLPVASYFLGTPPSPAQLSILKDTSWYVLAVILYTFLVGQATGNNSQVDKLWSIVPVFYVWYMTAAAGWLPRMVLMSALVTLWGIRLTYNFARRGAYTWKFWAGEEDYRWEILRKKPVLNRPWVWFLFNLFFICIYQNTLIFLFTLPVLTAVGTPAVIGGWDYILAFLFLIFLLIEFIADQQQYDFQKEKYRRIRDNAPAGPYAVGFVSTGLWSYVRHPNYAAEQAIWIVFYLFGVISTGEILNWTIAGAALLVLLFKGSSDFSEEISSSKYPSYKEYQERVPRFIPWKKF